MNAQEKMSQIISYVCETVPGIALEKKWNRLLRDFSKELELLEEAAKDNADLRARMEAAEALAKKWQNKNKYAADVVICGEELAAALAEKGAG